MARWRQVSRWTRSTLLSREGLERCGVSSARDQSRDGYEAQRRGFQLSLRGLLAAFIVNAAIGMSLGMVVVETRHDMPVRFTRVVGVPMRMHMRAKAILASEQAKREKNAKKAHVNQNDNSFVTHVP